MQCAGCGVWDSRRKKAGKPQVKADLGWAASSGPHTGQCTGTHAQDGGSRGGPKASSPFSMGAKHTGGSKFSRPG